MVNRKRAIEWVAERDVLLALVIAVPLVWLERKWREGRA